MQASQVRDPAVRAGGASVGGGMPPAWLSRVANLPAIRSRLNAGLRCRRPIHVPTLPPRAHVSRYRLPRPAVAEVSLADLSTISTLPSALDTGQFCLACSAIRRNSLSPRRGTSASVSRSMRVMAS